ncbi:hypothetical protein IVB25_01095 [Bradyrhizobium sp. 193]|uniref:hypothetical protein n=1 Tax=Bradyrhizobium sp. 193 TaxID=2782661 RepID=UPI001FF90E7E|nr:hypothetical protein [Bradyrhizobium sp. 193]MCK1481397.1 hypothetical protein [Bradyrhizobium sp. 193]
MAAIEVAVVACIARLPVSHPEIASIRSDLAAFPMVGPASRRMTNLPVYEITDLYRMTLASVA